jgi:hypothetical protein
VPFQFLLVSPVLAPVWIAGLVRLFRHPALRPVRFVAWAWIVLAVVFMATGGKPYYLAGLLPALLGAGGGAVDEWLERGRAAVRRALLVAGIATSAAVSLIVSLPVLPAGDSDVVVAVNGDVGETIGWPELVRSVASVERDLPGKRRPVILTRNYGEAGAIDRYGPALGLPRAYSGHNGYANWGPPPDRASPVIAIGFDPGERATPLRDCRLVARIDNDADVDNDEQGAPIAVCDGPRHAWSREWPALRRLG